MTDFSAFKLGLAAGITVGLAQYAKMIGDEITGDASGLEYAFDQSLMKLTVTDTGVAGNTFALKSGVLTVEDYIVFYINGRAYSADPGSTWRNFAESDLSDDFYPVTIDERGRVLCDGYIITNEKGYEVEPDWFITEGAYYEAW